MDEDIPLPVDTTSGRTEMTQFRPKPSSDWAIVEADPTVDEHRLAVAPKQTDL
jgi:hypothetical protein